MTNSSLSSRAAADSLDAITFGVTKLRLYTENYVTLLAEFSITFNPATDFLPSIASISGTPISTTALAAGDALAFRVINDLDEVRWQGSGIGAVGLNTSNAIVKLSNTNLMTGQEVLLNTMALSSTGQLKLPE